MAQLNKQAALANLSRRSLWGSNPSSQSPRRKNLRSIDSFFTHCQHSPLDQRTRGWLYHPFEPHLGKALPLCGSEPALGVLNMVVCVHAKDTHPHRTSLHKHSRLGLLPHQTVNICHQSTSVGGGFSALFIDRP